MAGRALLAILVMALPPVALFGGRSLYRGWKSRTLEAEAAKACRLAAEGKTEQAMSLTTALLKMFPSEPVVMRAAGWSYLETRPYLARQHFRRLLDSGKATAEDRLRYAVALLREDDPAGAFVHAGALLANHCGDVDGWLLWAETCVSRERPAWALAALSTPPLSLLQGSAKQQARRKEVQLRLSGQADAPAMLAQALQEVELALKRKDTAAASLLLDPVLPYSALDQGLHGRLKQLLVQLPQPTLKERVMLDFLESQQPGFIAIPGQVSPALVKIVRAAVASDTDSAADALAFAQALGWHQLVLAATGHYQQFMPPEIFARRMDSLLAIRDWDQARELIQRTDLRLSPDVKALLQAVLNLAQGDDPSPEGLKEALGEAIKHGHQGLCRVIAQTAAAHGLYALAAEASSEALAMSGSEQAPVDLFVRLARLAGWEAGRIGAVLKQRRHLDALNLHLELHDLYFDLLTGQGLERAGDRIAALRALLPEEPRLHLLGALYCLRMGDDAGLRALLKDPPSGGHAWLQGEATAMAALHETAGHKAAAEELAEVLNGKGVLAEEMQLQRRAQALSSRERDRTERAVRLLSSTER